MKKLKEKLSLLDHTQLIVLSLVIGVCTALVITHITGTFEYYRVSYREVIRIPKNGYLNPEKGADVYTVVKINYLMYFSMLTIISGIAYLYLRNIDFAEVKDQTN